MARNRWTLLLLREDHSNRTQIGISRLRAILFSVLFIAVIGGVTYSASKFIARHMTRIAMSEVVQENIELHRQLETIEKRMVLVDEHLSDLYSSDDNLRLAVGIPRIDEEVREVGVGGAAAPTLNYDEKDSTVHQLIYDLDKIEREIQLQKESFIEIQKRFADREDLIRHTPSLRPVKGGYVSSPFGWRPDPFTGVRTHHNGIDISIEKGTPVHASADGVVKFCKSSPGFGKMVIVDHGYGFRTFYAHLNKFSVEYNDKVKRGQKIGEVGNTGRSTGPHLHYEVQVARKAVNPMDYLYDSFSVNP